MLPSPDFPDTCCCSDRKPPLSSGCGSRGQELPPHCTSVTGQHSAPGCQPSPPPSSWVLWGQAGPVGAPVVFSLQACPVWTLATAPCVHAFPYLFLSSAPKGALPGPAADSPSPDQGPRAQAMPQSSPTRPRVSQLTALTQTGDSRPTQGEAMSTAMPTKVLLSLPRGSGSQHTQAGDAPGCRASATCLRSPGGACAGRGAPCARRCVTGKVTRNRPQRHTPQKGCVPGSPHGWLSRVHVRCPPPAGLHSRRGQHPQVPGLPAPEPQPRTCFPPTTPG